jgi:uncharacterized Zn finger protein
MARTTWPSCPSCGEANIEVLHEASPDADRTDATLRCKTCDQVFKDVLEKQPTQAQVSAVISEGSQSRSTSLDVPAEDPIAVDDELYADGRRLLVTAVERDDGRRVDEAHPDDLGTVWCKTFDRVELPVAVNQGRKTWSDEIQAQPEARFFVGDEMKLEGVDVEIHSIKTDDGIIHDGEARARDIVRLYGWTEYRETEEENW